MAWLFSSDREFVSLGTYNKLWANIEYRIATRTGEEVKVEARPVVFFKGNGYDTWHNPEIQTRLALGSGSYSGWQTVYSGGNLTINGTRRFDGSWRSVDTTSTSSSYTIKAQFWSGATNNTITLSAGVKLPPIPIPNAPTISYISGSRGATSSRINWSTNINIDKIGYKVGSGSEVYYDYTSGRKSGTRTVSGLTGGKNSSVSVRVRSSGAKKWSGYRKINLRGNHISTLSSYSLTPTKGTNNSLTLGVKGAQTGGTTTIEYKLSSASSWTKTTGGTISGLSNNTEYTVNLRARNSEGTIKTYNATARTHAAPSGSFSLTQQNKTQITINHTASYTTSTEYSFNGGAWKEYYSGLKLPGLIPGTTYKINVRFLNSDTELVTTLGDQSIRLTPNVVPDLRFKNIVRYRGHVSILVEGATDVQYRYIESGDSTWSSWQTANMNGDTRVPLSGHLYSDTIYRVEARAKDEESGQWGDVNSKNFKTASFRPPTVTKTSEMLTSLEFDAKPLDSCKLKRVVDTNVTQWPVWTATTKPVEVVKYKGNNLEANTEYSLSFVFEDQYGKPGVEYTVSERATTKPLDQASINLSNAANGNIDIIRLDQIQSSPILSLGTTTGNYSKSTVFTLGSRARTVSWTTSKNETLTLNELKAITRAMTSSTTYKINYVTSYTEGGRVSLSKQQGSIDIKLNNTLQLLLKPPTLSVSYDSSEKKKIALSRLYTKEINQATFTYSAPIPVEGSPIETATITFNGKTQNISKTSSGAIKTGLIQNNISNSTATLTIVDKRGLRATSEINVLYTNYSYPTISISSYGREGGFGDIVQFNDFRMAFTPTTNDSKINNTITRVSVRRGIGGIGDAPQELKINTTTGTSGNLISHMKLGTIGTSGNYGPEQVKIGPGATNNPSETNKWFQEENAYRLEIYVRDSFYNETGVEAELKGIVIATGKGIIFFDQVNRQVGVNTTVPRGRFEVDGDAFFENIYTLNTFVINEDDLEDI